MQLEKQNQESVETYAAFKSEMEALNKALQTYISRPVSPPPPPPPAPPFPPVPDMQTIIDAVEPSILRSVRDDISPTVEQLKESVQAMMKKQNTQVAQNVMSKLHLTLQTVEVIHAWMNRMVAGQMPPPATTLTNPTAPPRQQQQANGNGVANGTVIGRSASQGGTPIAGIHGIPASVGSAVVPQ